MVKVPLDELTTLHVGRAYTITVRRDEMLDHPIASVRAWQMGDQAPLTVERTMVCDHVVLTELPAGV